MFLHRRTLLIHQ